MCEPACVSLCVCLCGRVSRRNTTSHSHTDDTVCVCVDACVRVRVCAVCILCTLCLSALASILRWGWRGGVCALYLALFTAHMSCTSDGFSRIETCESHWFFQTQSNLARWPFETELLLICVCVCPGKAAGAQKRATV